MANSQYTQNQLFQEQQSASLEDKSKELSRILSDLLDTVKNKININNFGDKHPEKDISRYIFNIQDKIKFSSDIFDSKYSKFMADQQKKIDLSFLYLWATFNDIFYIRILIKEQNVSIFKYDKERGIPIEYDAKSTIDNYLSDNKELYPKRKKHLKDFRDNLQKNNTSYLIDFIWLLFLYEEKEYLEKFNKCRFKRNNLSMIHGNVLKPVFVRKDHIENMKDLIELLLYLK